MVLKLNQKVEFCDKKRKFTRCPNKTLKDYRKNIEQIQKDLEPHLEKSRDFQFQLTELEEEMGSIDKHIELLEKLEDASDDEIRECIGLTKEKIKLQKQIHGLRRENDDYEKENLDYMKEVEEKLRASYGEFASKIFEDFHPSEIEEADSTDLTIAPRLDDLYRLALSGGSQKDIDKLYQKIVKDSFR